MTLDMLICLKSLPIFILLQASLVLNQQKVVLDMSGNGLLVTHHALSSQ